MTTLYLITLKNISTGYLQGLKNAGTVHVVHSIDQVPQRFRERANKMKGVQGFYIPNTGESYLITGNIRDAQEAFKTWVHEVGCS